jgi:3D (Asp-Asp-Asp) domain-containing protein
MKRTSHLFLATCTVALLANGCAGNLRPKDKDQPKLPPAAPSTQPPPQARAFTATAYCNGTRTASGTRPTTANTVAADPAVLPLGSRIRLSGLHKPYNGDYVVEDTGPKVRGRRVDLYVSDCREAVRFGRRSASVALLQK